MKKCVARIVLVEDADRVSRIERGYELASDVVNGLQMARRDEAGDARDRKSRLCHRPEGMDIGAESPAYSVG